MLPAGPPPMTATSSGSENTVSGRGSEADGRSPSDVGDAPVRRLVELGQQGIHPQEALGRQPDLVPVERHHALPLQLVEGRAELLCQLDSELLPEIPGIELAELQLQDGFPNQPFLLGCRQGAINGERTPFEGLQIGVPGRSVLVMHTLQVAKRCHPR